MNTQSSETLVDIDGNTYRTVKIGSQIWTAENLKVSHYRNGDPIPNVNGKPEWINLNAHAYCCYDNDESFAATYGRLYNWYAVHESRNIAPAGWHVPTDKEWKELEMHLGMTQAEADSSYKRGVHTCGKMAAAGTNESGFSALPAGYRGHDAYFGGLDSQALFWSASEKGKTEKWIRMFDFNRSNISREQRNARFGLSVRLVKD